MGLTWPEFIAWLCVDSLTCGLVGVGARELLARLRVAHFGGAPLLGACVAGIGYLAVLAALHNTPMHIAMGNWDHVAVAHIGMGLRRVHSARTVGAWARLPPDVAHRYFRWWWNCAHLAHDSHRLLRSLQVFFALCICPLPLTAPINTLVSSGW